MKLTRNSTEIIGIPRMIVLAVLGAFLGAVAVGFWNPLPLWSRTKLVEAPYRTPQIPGGTPLRMAMVHDVIHERYLRHGPAWYARRNDLSRQIISKYAKSESAAPATEYLDAMDDLAVGLESTGKYDEAIAILRKKLELLSPLPALPATQPAANRQAYLSEDQQKEELRSIIAAQNLPIKVHHQYTTCANLGTMLVHSAMPKAMAGDIAARSTVREGLQFIRLSIAINPGAHFGRENWQAIAIEHLLAAMDHPDILTSYDLIGDSIQSIEPLHQGTGYVLRIPDPISESQLTLDQRVNRRHWVTRIGIDKDWAEIVNPDYSAPRAFDEPTLGIIGMWTLGGGANPHFALALATIMDIVNQPLIAWNGSERAVELSDKFWPEASVRKKMVDHCRARQLDIAKHKAPDNPDKWQSDLRAVHQKELAYGKQYQQEYQDFESRQIAKGVSLDDPHFYDPFFANHPSIASAPGLSDDYYVTYTQGKVFTDYLPSMVLGMGLATAAGLWRNGKRETGVV